MTNPILFPGYVRVKDGLWYGCRKFSHIGEVKEAIPVKDWERLYQRDLRRFLREEFNGARPSGDHAA